MQNVENLIELANRGWAIFPLAPNSRVPMAGSKGFNDATRDPNTIRAWWTQHPDANVGLRTGAESGVFVLDVDVKHGAKGLESLSDMESEFGALPSTLTATTTSGGKHYFFQHPGSRVKNRTGFRPGLDIRGDGGYVAIDPSRIGGSPYRWDNPGQELAEAPEWLLGVIDRPAISHTTTHASSNARVALTGVPEGQRNASVFRLACSLRGRGLPREEAEIIIMSAASKCSPPMDTVEAHRCLESAYGRYGPSVTRPFSDLGNAERLVDRYGDYIRFVPEHGGWIVWEDVRWRSDRTGVVNQLAKTVVRAIPEELSANGDPEAAAATKKKARAFEQKARLEAMIQLAAHEPGITIPANALDADPWKFAARNAVIDLRSGEAVPAKPDMYITKHGGVDFDSEATCFRWEQFIDEITGGNTEQAAYLQRAVGYTLTGDAREQSLFILHGTGANGKSTFIDIIQEVMGDYAKAVASETLMMQRIRSSSGPTEDLARLHGARLAATTETEEGQIFAEAFVKRMTGGDTIVARLPYAKHSFEFKPHFKLWIAANHRPIVRGDDHAIWRRIHLLPFEQRFEGERKDPNLPKCLRQELPGILNWALQGCLDWQEQGLNPPESVRAAVGDYREDMDLLSEWLEAECEHHPEHFATVTELYRSYCFWCDLAATKPLDRRIFGRKLSTKGFVRHKQRGERGYRGLKLIKKWTWPLSEAVG